MKEVKFLNIKRSMNRIDFLISYSINGDVFSCEEAFYEFKEPFYPSDLALSLSFCCMVKNIERLYIELPVPSYIASAISKNLNCEFDCIKSNNELVNSGAYITDSNKIMLLFSGGVDSMAASLLLPKSCTYLLAFDYGEQFTRESLFFQKFNPITIKTNFRNTLFFRHMEPLHPPAFGLGSILYHEYLSSFYVGTGDILESSHDFNCHLVSQTFPSSLLGIKQVRPTLGLTEIGTAMVVYNQYKDNENLINNMLNSVAPKGTAKRLRKEIIFKFLGANIEISPLKNSLKFGQDYVMDFLYMYIHKHNKELSNFMVSNVPQEVIDFIEHCNLDFYKKINPKCFGTMYSNEIINYYIKMLSTNAIDIYCLDDFVELCAVRDVLCKYYGEHNNNFYNFNTK